MQIYLVGGAVRDGLLGLPVDERDWVVVGADAAAMRAEGYVPADPTFPVFRHPQTGDEYALARREVKRGEGYRGFEVDARPDVTLEEDLRRRDLTVNAMAQGADGAIVDPYGGRDDLDARLLRHVSAAFVEDPVRVLRVARFAAKLGANGFRVAHATHRLMRQMVARGDIAHLAPERLWREMVKAMRAAQPWRFFEVLQRCGALQVLIPQLAAAMGTAGAHGDGPDSPPIAALKRLSRDAEPASQRLAAVLWCCADSPADADRLSAALRADRTTAQLLRRAVSGRALCGAAAGADCEAMFELATLWRAFDAHGEFEATLAVCAAQYADARFAAGLHAAVAAARAVSAAQLRSRGISGAELGSAIASARREAMAGALRDAGLLP